MGANLNPYLTFSETWEILLKDNDQHIVLHDEHQCVGRILQRGEIRLAKIAERGDFTVMDKSDFTPHQMSLLSKWQGTPDFIWENELFTREFPVSLPITYFDGINERKAKILFYCNEKQDRYFMYLLDFEYKPHPFIVYFLKIVEE